MGPERAGSKRGSCSLRGGDAGVSAVAAALGQHRAARQPRAVGGDRAVLPSVRCRARRSVADRRRREVGRAVQIQREQPRLRGEDQARRFCGGVLRRELPRRGDGLRQERVEVCAQGSGGVSRRRSGAQMGGRRSSRVSSRVAAGVSRARAAADGGRGAHLLTMTIARSEKPTSRWQLWITCTFLMEAGCTGARADTHAPPAQRSSPLLLPWGGVGSESGALWGCAGASGRRASRRASRRATPPGRMAAMTGRGAVVGRGPFAVGGP